MNAPYHLAKFNTNIDNKFISNEEIYRRCPFGNRTPPFTIMDMFLDIQWDNDLIKGLSVNRSKFATPMDTLRAIVFEDTDQKKCHYQQKNAVVYKSKANSYPIADTKTGVMFRITHSPINCNISHCDISIENVPDKINNPTKREVKAFLATFFQEIAEPDKTPSQDKIHSESSVIEASKGSYVFRKPLLLLIAFCLIILILFALLK